MVRRSVAPVFAVLVVFLAGTSFLRAQLPPEIELDRLLQRVERQIAGGDFLMASESLEEAAALRDRHDLELPTEFWFRKAQVSLQVGLASQAAEEVVVYLTAAGRSGDHYRAALDLLDAAEDAKSAEDARSREEELNQAALLEFGWSVEDGLVDDVHRAVYHRDPRVVRALVDAGADVNARADAYSGDDSDLWTPLYRAVVGADSEHELAIVRALLEAGADPDVPSSDGWTPLYNAVIGAESDIDLALVQALLDAGADPEISDSDGWTPLYRAVVGADSEHELAIVRALLEAGADPDVPSSDGRTPLYNAVIGAESDIDLALVQALLDAGADPEIPDSDGWTPLYNAVIGAESKIEVAIVRALLEAGANVNHVVGKRSVLDAAGKRGAVADAVRTAGGRRGKDLRKARKEGRGWGRVATAVLGGSAIAAAGDGSELAVEAGLDFAGEVLGDGGGVFDSTLADGLLDGPPVSQGSSLAGIPGCQEFSAPALENDRQAWTQCGNVYANRCRIKQISDPSYKAKYPEVSQARIDQGIAESRAIISRSCQAITVTGSSVSACPYCQQP